MIHDLEMLVWWTSVISIQGGERASTSICLVKYWTLLLILGEREDASNLFNYGMMQDVNFHLVIERERERESSCFSGCSRWVPWDGETSCMTVGHIRSWDLSVGDNPVRCCWSLGSLLFDRWRKATELAMTHGSIPTAASKLLCPP